MILILLSGCCINILIDALIAGDIYLTYPLILNAFVAIICYMYSFIFYLVSSFISAMCCDLMSIVQVAFVNPLINELCMYVCTNSWPNAPTETLMTRPAMLKTHVDSILKPRLQ